MGDIGASIVNGAFGAVGHLLGAIPIMFWVVLILAVIAGIFIIRYITDWHIVVPLVGVFFILSEVMVWRAHWIGQGRAEAEAQVKAAQAQVQAYKMTNLKIMDCYTHEGQLWDRTQGKCLRVDGAR